ncbi:MAG TPA: hypothetical protein DD856_03200 [Sulfobacillus sp.]|nr:hypothetical protein [Sulfobacillus sp.]
MRGQLPITDSAEILPVSRPVLPLPLADRPHTTGTHPVLADYRIGRLKIRLAPSNIMWLALASGVSKWYQFAGRVRHASPGSRGQVSESLQPLNIRSGPQSQCRFNPSLRTILLPS